MDNFMDFIKPHVEAYLAVLKKFTVFEGRTGRKEFLMFVLYNIIISVLIGILYSLPFVGKFFYIFSGLLSLAMCVVSFAIGVRRLHDTNRSGMTYLLALIPMVGWVILIIFWVQEGNPGANKYGSAPKTGGGSRVAKTKTKKKTSAKKGK